ncbi:YeeE/YedE family protein [Endozoicomonas sp. Mp262]|uniref:YeeE/YedE family protein n=1 Tax=Endozoicomonas sp. Mp262 TaxID=2919499 RepID=UPI0021DB378F
MFNLFAALSGLLFGLGMALSGMTNPENVIGFLDVAGKWNPSLIFVMGGALLLFMPVYFFWIKPMQAPIYGTDFKFTARQNIDKSLLTGAVLFGLGWGLAGICPGPAVTALGGKSVDALVFVISMLLGMALQGRAKAGKSHPT